MAIVLKMAGPVPGGKAAPPGCPSPHHHLRVAQMLRTTHPPNQHTHKRKFTPCSGFGSDRLKAKQPASTAFRQPASCRQYHSTLQSACQSGFGVIERSNLVLPVHYLNPVFYMALLSAWASLGKTAPKLSWPSISSHQGTSSPPAMLSSPTCVLDRENVCTRSGSSHG